jgi:UDP-glucose 4-epimerase/UDP-glucuronate decarboxylase
VKALLLGGGGFIGVHLARRLVADGYDVTIVDDFSRGKRDRDLAKLRRHPSVSVVSGDLTTTETWAGIAHDFDRVFLLAAVVGVRNVERDPMRTLRVNSLTALHLADWAVPGDRVFFASTSEVYAGSVEAGLAHVPTAEDAHLLVPDPAAPRSTYAVSKLFGEAALLQAARVKGFTVTVGRFHNVYGPRMGTDHVIPEMMLRAMRGEDPFRVPGAAHSRAFCYIDDAVEAIVRLVDTPAAAGRIVNIGDDTSEITIRDLADLVLSTCSRSPAISAEPPPAGSVSRRCPDIGLLRKLTDFEPAVALSDGVRRTYEWYREFAESGYGLAAGASLRPIAFYYGAGELERLATYRRVVLQPDFYTPEELAFLRDRGVHPLAYLSLSQDHGPAAPWQRPDRDPDWGGAMVFVDHPGWVSHVARQARTALDAGFVGLFLDTLNVELTHPEDVPHLTALIATLRDEAGTAYILANRGFGMLPRLVELVDGILFESFSVRWTEDGYAPWPPDVLEHHAQIAERLLEFDVDLYALDYADGGLAEFATRRARQFGLHSFISDRALSRL